MAHVIEEFQVLGRYHVMILDQDAPQGRYRINGRTFEPVELHTGVSPAAIPRNYIAVRSTESFRGAAVEFV